MYLIDLYTGDAKNICQAGGCSILPNGVSLDTNELDQKRFVIAPTMLKAYEALSFFYTRNLLTIDAELQILRRIAPAPIKKEKKIVAPTRKQRVSAPIKSKKKIAVPTSEKARLAKRLKAVSTGSFYPDVAVAGNDDVGIGTGDSNEHDASHNEKGLRVAAKIAARKEYHHASTEQLAVLQKSGIQFEPLANNNSLYKSLYWCDSDGYIIGVLMPSIGLKVIPEFIYQLPKLEHLCLTGNRIITFNLSAEMPCLKVLWLSNNNIQSRDVDVMDKLPKIQKIFLRNNSKRLKILLGFGSMLKLKQQGVIVL